MKNVINFFKQSNPIVTKVIKEELTGEDVKQFTKWIKYLEQGFLEHNKIDSEQKVSAALKELSNIPNSQVPKLSIFIFPQYIEHKFIGRNYYGAKLAVYETLALMLLKTDAAYQSRHLCIILDSLLTSDIRSSCEDFCYKVLKLVEHYLFNNLIDSELKQRLEEINNRLSSSYSDSKTAKFARDLANKTDPFGILINQGDAWSDKLIFDMYNFLGNERTVWEDLLRHCINCSAAKPSTNWLSKSQVLINNIGKEEFVEKLIEWLSYFPNKRNKLPVTQDLRECDVSLLYDEHNSNYLKGLIWCASQLSSDGLVAALKVTANASFKKVPGYGYRSKKIGNAIVFALSHMQGLNALYGLLSIRTKISQKQTLRIIDIALGEVAETNRLTVDDLSELGVPTFELDLNGNTQRDVENYKALIKVNTDGKVLTKWQVPTGKIQGSVPKALNDSSADRITEIKTLAKDIKFSLIQEKKRLEQLWMNQAKWDFQTWLTRYVNHPLIRVLTNTLIWKITIDEHALTVMIKDNNFVNSKGDILTINQEFSTVCLWHPAVSKLEEIEAWQLYLIEQKITQPFKQAFREVFLLNEDELLNKQYSNRYASHILEQGYFRQIAESRGWQMPIIGNWDCDTAIRKTFTKQGLILELQIQPLGDEDNIDNRGIYIHITVDQVRFYNAEDNSLKYLNSVDPIIISEVFRDIDLFITKSSIGNNQHWRDTQLENKYKQYWYAFNYGDLDEKALYRKAQVTKILPYLGIEGKYQIDKKYLVIKGEKHKFFIHFGSSSVLVEPGEKYIYVPDRILKKATSKIKFLPLNKDDTFSKILELSMYFTNEFEALDNEIREQLE